MSEPTVDHGRTGDGPTSQTDTHAQSYAEFIRMGDMVLDDSLTPEQSSTSTMPSQERNDNAATANPDGRQNHPPTSFFSTFFRKATTTLESSLQAAQQNGSEAFSSAQQHVSAASSSAYSTVSGLVHDIGTTFNPPDAPGSSGYPPITIALKTIRVPAPALPLLLIPAPEPTVATDTAIYRFPSDASSPVITQLKKTQTQTNSSSEPGISSTSTPVQATHALSTPDSRLALSLRDGSIALFSISRDSESNSCVATAPHPSPITSLAAMLPIGIAAARRDGSVQLLNAALQPVVNLTPPAICTMPLTPTLSYAAPIALSPVSHLSQITSNQNQWTTYPAIIVAYDDGVVASFTRSGELSAPPFIAHAGAVSGITTLFEGILVVTIGNENDKSIAVFDASTGRCLARRALSYVPKFVTRAVQNIARCTSDVPTCASESAIIVAGDEGQVELFRIVVLSPRKLDVKFILQVSDKFRGKKRLPVDINYTRFNAVLTILYDNGEIRRWQLSKDDAMLFSRLEEDVNTGATFTQANIEGMIDKENRSDDQPLSHGVNGVIRAQTILASILEDQSVAEEKKDELAGSFQRRQAKMVKALSEAETEGRRARRRVFGQFSAGIKTKCIPASLLEGRLEVETRRAAALEAEFVSRRYTNKVRGIETQTVGQLQNLLRKFINSLAGSDSLIIEQARRDVEMLGTEDADIEVD